MAKNKIIYPRIEFPFSISSIVITIIIIIVIIIAFSQLIYYSSTYLYLVLYMQDTKLVDL